MHRFVGDGARLLDHGGPASRFDRRERVKNSLALTVATLVAANIVDQSLGRRNRLAIRFEVVAEKRRAILIDNLATGLISEIDHRQTPADPLDQDGDADEADRRTIGRPDRTNEISRDPIIGRARMDW